MSTTKGFCEYCGKEFIKKKYWQKFCGATCRMSKWMNEHPRIDIKRKRIIDIIDDEEKVMKEIIDNE